MVDFDHPLVPSALTMYGPMPCITFNKAATALNKISAKLLAQTAFPANSGNMRACRSLTNPTY